MILDLISSAPILIHHLTQIGGSLLSDTTYLVALSDFRSQPSIVRLPPAATFSNHVIDHEVPVPKDVLSASAKSTFLSLRADLKVVDSY